MYKKYEGIKQHCSKEKLQVCFWLCATSEDSSPVSVFLPNQEPFPFQTVFSHIQTTEIVCTYFFIHFLLLLVCFPTKPCFIVVNGLYTDKLFLFGLFTQAFPRSQYQQIIRKLPLGAMIFVVTNSKAETVMRRYQI